MQPGDVCGGGQVQLFIVGLQLPRHMSRTELLRQQDRRAELVQQSAALGGSEIECARQFAVGARRERGDDFCAAERAAQLETLVGAFGPKGEIGRRKRLAARSQRPASRRWAQVAREAAQGRKNPPP